MGKAILEQVEEFYGSRAEMARRLDVWPPNVSGWFSGIRPVPALAALQIEIESDGRLKAEKVSPTQIRKIRAIRSVVAKLAERGYPSQVGST